jgi:hypothetical protein
MTCEEHESAPRMYCQKCDAYVCDSCHKRDYLDHYHYLFLEKLSPIEEPVEKAATSSHEENLSIEDKVEQIIQRQNQESIQQEEPEIKQEGDTHQQQEQERLRQKALAAINRSKELKEDH